MRLRSGLRVLTACACVSVLSAAPTFRGQDGALPFSCEVFAPDTTAAALAARFGAVNVTTAPVPWGGAEGDLNEGTVLFDATSDARLDIYWRDHVNQRDPAWVSVRGTRTRWRSPGGVTLGTPLRAIEQLNGRPFRLLGFGSDVQGTVMTWSGGRLEAQNTAACVVRVRVRPVWEKVDATRAALRHQLVGEPQYSSGHPAMQALDPEVYEMFLSYGPAPARAQSEPARR